MISRKIIADIRSLQLSKNREEQYLFVAEGEKVVSELIDSDYKIRFLIGLEEYLEKSRDLLVDVEHYQVSEAELKKASSLTNPNKVLAVAEIPTGEINAFDKEEKLILVLDGIRDPGNMGTIIRTADWFGINTLICSVDCVDCYNPKVVQGAMGSLFRSNIDYRDLMPFIRDGKDRGYRILSTAMNGNTIETIDNSLKSIVIIGNESNGIRKEIHDFSDLTLLIPKNENSLAESLNAAVACGIILSRFTS